MLGFLLTAVTNTALAGEPVDAMKLYADSTDKGPFKAISTTEMVHMEELFTAMFQGIFVFQVHDFYHVDFTEHIDFIFDAFRKELDPQNNTKQKG